MGSVHFWHNISLLASLGMAGLAGYAECTLEPIEFVQRLSMRLLDLIQAFPPMQVGVL
jgi:hypothetical protein